MAVKKAATAEKKAAPKKAAAAAAAAPVAKKTTTRKKVTQGSAYECVVCGLAVTVDEDCGCIDTCDIICCGKPMKEKKAR